MSTILGRPITMGGGGKLPDIFGDGSDGDLVIKAGETVTLPVPVPHQSVIEMQYKSITIEAGGTLTTSDPNAGLVLRCQGDCNISGTIDQSGKAPKTNPSSTYQYPEELVCGAGGNGGRGRNENMYNGGDGGLGGTGMAARPYGGGYGGGGGGGGSGWASSGSNGGAGGNGDVAIDVNAMFVGGAGGNRSNRRGGTGAYGGGGGGAAADHSDSIYDGGAGGNGPGGNGQKSTDASRSQGNGGGAGNLGGGVVLLYVGGSILMEGTINCNGLDGGKGGETKNPGSSTATHTNGGGGGGGGGGGAIYILHMGTQTVTGSMQVDGGSGGGGGGSAGAAGTVGTTTIKQYEEGMTA